MTSSGPADVTFLLNASATTTTTPSPPPPQQPWQVNFFSIFIEHPAMRNRAGVYMTFRTISLAFLLPAGLLGNSLTVAVMLRPRMRKQSVSLTLSLLAVSDGCCLLIRGLLWVNLVSAKWGYRYLLPVRLQSDGVCRAAEYLFSAIHIVGSWIVVYITIERMVVVLFPIKAAIVCRPATARVVLPFCFLGPFLLLSYLPVISHYVEGVGCVTRVQPDMIIHFFMATTFVSMLPLTLIAICNIAIVQRLTCQALQSSTTQQLTMSESKRSDNLRRVTNMVLSVSFAFLASVFPQAANAVMRILNPRWRWLSTTDDICAILWDCNYAINFYLYVITGRSVRAELRQMLGVDRCCGSKGGDGGVESGRGSVHGAQVVSTGGTGSHKF